MRRLLVGLLLVGLVASLFGLWVIKQALTQGQSADALADRRTRSLAPLFPAPDFGFVAQNGKPVRRASLLGHVWVADFIFTTCRTVCPALSAKMVRLQKDVDDPAVRFVSFSVDPEHDTPEVLREYGAKWNPRETRWLLLSTTEGKLAELTRGFHVVAQHQDAGPDPIMHSSVFVLVDAQGEVRGVYDSDDAESFTALRDGLETLTGGKRAHPPTARSGELLYHDMSCIHCHEDPNLAPPLGGLLGKDRELDTRLRVKADEAYIRESILAPEAKRVAGYTLKMPSYAGLMSSQELDGLVKYVEALPELPSAAAQTAAIAVDPTCGMKVRAGPGTLSASADGGTVYFCSPRCRDAYLATHGGGDAGVDAVQ